MRLYIVVDTEDRPKVHIPWNYHLSVQSAVYDALNEHAPTVATELHQLEHDPPFSFSEFIPTAPYNVGDDGLAITQGLFAFTSDRSEILDAIASYAIAGNLTLGHSTLPVIGTDIEPVHGVERATYRTVSPVCTSQYIDDRREYLRPDDGMWYARLRDSVRDRLDGEWGFPDDFEFSVDEIHWTKPKSLRINESAWAKCARFEADIRADPVTSEFIQTHGLGERTGMGFGSIVPTDHLPQGAR